MVVYGKRKSRFKSFESKGVDAMLVAGAQIIPKIQ
jgi:hypothetical protein